MLSNFLFSFRSPEPVMNDVFCVVVQDSVNSAFWSEGCSLEELSDSLPSEFQSRYQLLFNFSSWTLANPAGALSLRNLLCLCVVSAVFTLHVFHSHRSEQHALQRSGLFLMHWLVQAQYCIYLKSLPVAMSLMAGYALVQVCRRHSQLKGRQLEDIIEGHHG